MVILDSYFLGGSAANSAIQINQGFFLWQKRYASGVWHEYN